MKKKATSFRLTEAAKNALEAYAEAYNMNTTEALENLLLFSLKKETECDSSFQSRASDPSPKHQEDMCYAMDKLFQYQERRRERMEEIRERERIRIESKEERERIETEAKRERGLDRRKQQPEPRGKAQINFPHETGFDFRND